MIAKVAQLPRNDELAEQFELLADLMELANADSFRIGAYRKAAARIRETSTSVAQLALEGQGDEAAGDRQDDRGEDRRGRRRRRGPCADQEEGRGAGRGRRLHAPARPRPEDRAPDLAGARDHHGRRAQGRRRGRAAARATPGSGPGRRRRSPRRSPRAAKRNRSRGARCSGRRCRGCVPSSTSCASTRRPSRSASPARRGGCARPFATSTSSRRPPIRQALVEYFCTLVVGRRGRGEGHDEGDRRLARRAALRPPGRAAGELRQPAAALHRLEEPQRRAARGRRSARALGLGVLGDARSRRGGASLRDRGRRCTAFLGYDWIPPELREDGGELKAARDGELPELVELARPARRPAHAHDLVRRQGHARGDGRGGAANAATPTTRSATTRSGCAATCCTCSRCRSTR